MVLFNGIIPKGGNFLCIFLIKLQLIRNYQKGLID